MTGTNIFFVYFLDFNKIDSYLSPNIIVEDWLTATTGNGSALCLTNGTGVDTGLSSAGGRPSSSSLDDPSAGTASTLKKSNRESPSASSLRKYAIQNNNLHKTESSVSVNSADRAAGSLSDSAQKETGGGKRASVVFEEPKGGSGYSVSGAVQQSRTTVTSKTVNGILRKGSLRGEDDKTGRAEQSSAARKSRKATERHKNERSHSGSSKSSRQRGSKLDSVTESGDGETDHGRNSRSRSNSTKSAKSEKRDANNLALTRDLPWCGCWGNGCL